MNISGMGKQACQKANRLIRSAQANSMELGTSVKQMASKHPGIAIGALGAATGIAIASAMHNKKSTIDLNG